MNLVSDEARQIIINYLEKFANGTITFDEQNVLDGYVEEVKNSNVPEEQNIVRKYNEIINKKRSETLEKEKVAKEQGQIKVLEKKQSNNNGHVVNICILLGTILSGIAAAIVLIYLKK